MVFGQQGALPPPPGVTPNFVDPETNVLATNIVGGIFTVATTALVILRVYTRTRITRNFGWDDAICVLAWPFLISFEGVWWGAQVWGYGRHLYDVDRTWIGPLYKILFAGELLYIPLTTLMKLTYLLFYLRIFLLGKARIAIWTGIFLLVAFQTSMFFTSLFYCDPIQGSWEPGIKAKCIDKDVASYGTGIFNIFIDFYILILPMPLLAKLHTENGRKYKVIALFGVGLFACIASILRFAYTIKIVGTKDPTWSSPVINTWSEIEVNIALSCSCFLTLPSFWRQCFPNGLASLTRIISSIFSTRRSHTPAPSDKQTPFRDIAVGRAPEQAHHISTMASITPGNEKYVPLHGMVDQTMLKQDMLRSHTECNMVDRNSPDCNVERHDSESGTTETSQGPVAHENDSQVFLSRNST